MPVLIWRRHKTVNIGTKLTECSWTNQAVNNTMVYAIMQKYLFSGEKNIKHLYKHILINRNSFEGGENT